MEALVLCVYGWAAMAVFFALLLHPVGRGHPGKAVVLAVAWPLSVFAFAALLIGAMREDHRMESEDNLP